MLLRRLRLPGVHAALAAPESYRPRWTAADRRLWDGHDEALRQYWIGRGERHLDFPWPPLDSMYSDYEQTGNRTRFEAVYHKRRQVTTTLVFAEAFENKGRFLQPLLDAMNRLCDEPSWVLPAHEKHVIDLFSAETANLLAWALYLFAHVPAFRDAAAAGRARQAIAQRVIDPYIERDDCWWMALNGEDAGNWTTWCTSNCLGTTLLLETGVERRAQAIEKACRSLDRFLEAYQEDGGCDEGPMYWNFAGGCLFDALEMLHEASGGAFDLFEHSAIRAIGAYIGKVHIHDLRFVNFADCPPEVPVDAALLYRFGVRVGDPHMQALAAHLNRLLDRFDPENTLRLKIYRGLATLADGQALSTLAGPDGAPLESYLPKLQVAVARNSSCTSNGLVLAAKGGHNNEQHNHNDVGNVIVYLDGRPVLVDVGLRQYTRDTFTERRYENWVVQSAYHNVPLVNGCMQEAGARFAAREAAFDPGRQGKDAVRFSIEIAGAYPSAAGLVCWKRTSTLARTTETIAIQDDYQFTSPDNCYEQRFITPCRPRIAGGEVVLPLDPELAVTLSTAPAPSRISLHAIALKDGHLKHAWGDTLFQVRLRFDILGTHGRSDTLLRVHRGTLPLRNGSDVPIETEELP